MRRQIILILFLVLVMLDRPALGQDLEATITLETSGTGSYTLAVLNSSPLEVVESVDVTLEGGHVFDSASGTTIPELGGQNDGISSATVSWPAELAANGLLESSGDIDPNAALSGVSATVNFTGAGPRTVDLGPTGTPGQWRAAIAETGQDPSPIINGQATATMSWTRPTERVDGTVLPLSEIAGYVLYWGTSSRVGKCGTDPVSRLDPCYGNTLDLVDGTLETTPLVLSLSGDATIYFAIIAYTISETGVVSLSAYSNEVTKRFELVITFPDAPPLPPGSFDVVMDVTCTTDQENVTCEFIVR